MAGATTASGRRGSQRAEAMASAGVHARRDPSVVRGERGQVPGGERRVHDPGGQPEQDQRWLEVERRGVRVEVVQ